MQSQNRIVSPPLGRSRSSAQPATWAGSPCISLRKVTVSAFHRFQEPRSIPASTPAARTALTSCTSWVRLR